VQWIDIIIIIIIIVVVVVVVYLITLLSIYVMGIHHISMGLGTVRGRNFALSSKVKGHVLGIWALYDTFVIVLLFVPLLRCFWINLYSLDILGSFW
jgi:multidrug resistance efflux pump